MWVQTHKLRDQIHELRVQIQELRVQIYELRVQIQELRVQIYELRVQIHELLDQWKSTQVSTLKSSSFLKIGSPKLFGNSWGNSCVQFLVIISCFTFPPLLLQQEAEWVNINFARRDLNFQQRSHPTIDDFGENCVFCCF